MSFVLDAVRDSPVALYLLDDTTPFQDYSGYGRTATATAAPQSAALVKGALLSTVFTDAVQGSFASPVFLQGRERDSFSLEAVCRPIIKPGATTVEQQILGNSGRQDGLTVNGTVVSFVVKFLGAGEARVSYDLGVLRKFHAVGVYTSSKVSLYIDGDLVGEVSTTEAQQATTFVATSANLVSGDTNAASTTGIALNAIGVYAQALPAEVIARHADVVNDVPSSEDVVYSFAGDVIPLGIDQTIHEETVFNDTYDGWVGNVVLPQDTTSIYGMVADWDGAGTVQASIDGSTWETLIKGTKPAVIPQNFNPTNKVLLVRAILTDNALVENLSVKVIKSAVLPAQAGRTVTITGASPRNNVEPFDFSDDAGIVIETGGNINISADTGDGTGTRVVEMWVKRNGAEPTISHTGERFVNGYSSGVWRDDEWTLLHIRSAASHGNAITITGAVQIGHLAIYDYAIPTATFPEIYKMYVGSNMVRLTDSSIIAVTEGATPVKIYSHDWSIQSAV